MKHELTRPPPGTLSRPIVAVKVAPHLRLAIPFLAAVLMTAAPLGWARAGESAQTTPSLTVQAQAVGIFTGQYVEGTPVYRLAPLTVVADRSEALAKMKRQAPLAHAKQAPSKSPARPPA